MDEGREEETWQDIKEIEFVDMRTFDSAQIDRWLNDRGFLHKEMYRTNPNAKVDVELTQEDL